MADFRDEDDMSFELTGPPIVIPFNLPSKRSFVTFAADDASTAPEQQSDRHGFNSNTELNSGFPAWLKWGIFRCLDALTFTSELLKAVYITTLFIASPASDSKRRLLSITKNVPAPSPLRGIKPPRRSPPRLFRQNSPTSSGHSSVTYIRPPKTRRLPSSPPCHVPGEFPLSPPRSPEDLIVSPTRYSPHFGIGGYVRTDLTTIPAVIEVSNGGPGFDATSAMDVSLPTEPAVTNDMMIDDDDDVASEGQEVDKDEIMEEPAGSVSQPVAPVSTAAARPVLTGYRLEHVKELQAIIARTSQARKVLVHKQQPRKQRLSLRETLKTKKANGSGLSPEYLSSVSEQQRLPSYELIEAEHSSSSVESQQQSSAIEVPVNSPQTSLSNSDQQESASGELTEAMQPSSNDSAQEQSATVDGLTERATDSPSPSDLPSPGIQTGSIELQRSPFGTNEEQSVIPDASLEQAQDLPSALHSPSSDIQNGLIELERSPQGNFEDQLPMMSGALEPPQAIPSSSDLPSTGNQTGLIELERSPLGISERQSLITNTSPAQSQALSILPISPSLGHQDGLIVLERSPPHTSGQSQTSTDGIDNPPRPTPNTPKQELTVPGSSDGSIELSRSPSKTSEQLPLALNLSPQNARRLPNQREHVRSILKDTKARSPDKGILSMFTSKFMIRKKRKSPLREAFNNANWMLKTPINKNARFLDNPVTRTRKFVKGEAISYPSPHSSRDENSILSVTPGRDITFISPTQQEQQAMIARQLMISSTNISSFGIGSTYCEANVAPPSSPIMSNTDSASRSPDRGEGPEASSSSGAEDSSNGHAPATPKQSPTAESQGSGLASSQSAATSDDGSSQTPITPTKDQDPIGLRNQLSDLDLSGRRSSRRTKSKDELDEQRRLEEEAIAAKKQARKDKAAAKEKARKEQAQAEERARLAREEAEEQARREAEEEEVKKWALRMPIEKVIQPLSEEWEQKVRAALAVRPSQAVAHTSRGTAITRRDIGMVLPQRGAGDSMSGWLNDSVIEAYMQAIVDHGNEAAGVKRGGIPKFHAFNAFFYTNLRDGGVDKVRRWANKAKIGGKDLLTVEWVFMPVNVGSNHWTLIAVSPTRKTIQYYDSFNGLVTNEFDNIRAWLQNELQEAYKEEEWTVVEDPAKPGRGKGPRQSNGSDCGVFTITTAKMLSLGVDPMAVSANDMPTQRKRMVAELIHGGFTDEFKPNIRFE